MNKDELKSLIKEVVTNEINLDPNLGTTTHVGNKPLLHLAYFDRTKVFVAATEHDQAMLVDEFGPEYGHSIPKDQDETLRYLTIKDVVMLLDLFNIFLEEG